MKSTKERIWSRMRSSRRALHAATDFADLGSRAAIDQALSRLAREGRIERASRGLYGLRSAAPSAREIAEAVGRSGTSLVVTSGAAAARRFGLTTAEPPADEFLTDGASREVRLGASTVRLRHAGRREMAGPPGKVGDALRALRWLGREMSDGHAVQVLRRELSGPERRALLRHAAGSQWLRDAAAQIASEKAPTQAPDRKSLRRKAGLVDRWLDPSGRRPEFDVPRFWSNRNLDERETIVALNVAKPTVPDLTRSILAYGAGPHVDALDRMEREGELSPRRAQVAAAELDTALRGVDDARRQLASA